jgi:hypothetical protein
MSADHAVLIRDLDTDAVLDQAAAYLKQHGWTPIGLYDTHSGCTRTCLCHRTGTYPASVIGAIRATVFGAPRWYLDTASDNDRHRYTAAVEWLNTYLLAIGHTGAYACLVDWQTTPGRIPADVTGALRAAAHAHRHHLRRTAA